MMKSQTMPAFAACLALALFGLAFVNSAAAGPRIEHWQSASGAKVYFVATDALPIIDVRVDFPAGSAYDPPGKEGLAQLTAGLLDLGAGTMNEDEIASSLADVGANLGTGAGLDRATVSLRTLAAKEKREASVKILGMVLSQPHFPQPVFEREKARARAMLKESLTHPDTIADRAFLSGLYGAHPYGQLVEPESLERIAHGELAAFYRAHYQAANASVTIVGALSKQEAEELAQKITAGLPQGGNVAALPTVTLPAQTEKRIAHPAAQSHILLGLPAVKRGDPDFFPLLVGNYTLGGGGFVSRLMNEVREKQGYAYSVYSYFMPAKEAGPFQIGLQTRRTQANDALRVAREVLDKFMAEGPSEEELRAAKRNLVGSFPLRLDSNRKILENVANIAFYGLPLDYLDRYQENIERVSIADVRAAFARHVHPGNIVTVVVAAD
ncbi:MAG: insulinase family protein [Betaproteobacteria bacterium]|nr:insulinase family protein [Betaproteobacteria bacterium]